NEPRAKLDAFARQAVPPKNRPRAADVMVPGVWGENDRATHTDEPVAPPPEEGHRPRPAVVPRGSPLRPCAICPTAANSLQSCHVLSGNLSATGRPRPFPPS